MLAFSRWPLTVNDPSEPRCERGAAPGSNSVRRRKSRPLIGSRSTCLLLTTSARALVSACKSGGSAETLTVSRMPPTCKTMSRETCPATGNSMPSISTTENPSRCANSEYAPGGRSGRVKSPSLFVVTCRFNPVAVLETVMATSGTTAPWLSMTMPLSVALLVCAPATTGNPPTKFKVNAANRAATGRPPTLLHQILISHSSQDVLENSPPKLGGEPFARFLANGGVVPQATTPSAPATATPPKLGGELLVIVPRVARRRSNRP